MSATNYQHPPKEPRRMGMWIDGNEVWSAGGGEIVRHSPAHEVPVSVIPEGSVEDVDRAVKFARYAFDNGHWPNLSGEQRAQVLLKMAHLVREHAQELAYLETLENGKSISQSMGEVLGSAGIWEYAAGLARTIHGETHNNLGSDLLGMVIRQPLGVIGVIVPWNFPLFILTERLPFILAAGSTAVIKPSELTSSTTILIAQLLQKAGLPDGVVNIVTGYGPVVGAAMSEHPLIDMISFTGSTVVGQEVMSSAAKTIKKVSLELGGKNPQIVFADADLDAAADAIVFGICYNSGQCCVSGSRILVERSVQKELDEKIKQLMAKIRIGDPLDPNTQFGAITDMKQFNKIKKYIEVGQNEGAVLICGGAVKNIGSGHYIQPTLFSNGNSSMVIAREEIFGPVAVSIAFDDHEEALKQANDSEYGLAASIWSSNIDTALSVARQVQAGRVWINTTIAGGPEMPIGGFKKSGLGRESGRYGIEEYTEVKSIHVALGKRSMWLG